MLTLSISAGHVNIQLLFRCTWHRSNIFLDYLWRF